MRRTTVFLVLASTATLSGLTAAAPRLPGPSSAPPSPASAAPVADAALAKEIRENLAALPYYGVFDLLSFQVNDGVVRLGGYALQPILRKEADDEVKQLDGVRDVRDGVELLPVSITDDQVRWAVFRAIYRDPFLSRYGQGRLPAHGGFPAHHPWGPGFRNWGVFGRPPWTVAPFFGQEPVGSYAIHIIEKNGHVTLAGVVDNARDRDLATKRARGAPGARSVENDLVALEGA
jgi:hyperosmotically inducible periplasmic protein